MSETKFTPGPWMVNGMKVCDDGYFTIAKCGWIGQSDHEAEANAALIAAAPEMYDMVVRLSDDLFKAACGVWDCEEKFASLRLVVEASVLLAKARGEEVQG